VVLTTGLTALALALYILAGRSLVRLTRARFHWRHFAAILKVGAVASVSTLQTSLTVALTTGIVAVAADAAGVAGYGTGARLEYLLIPLVFGLGAPLVALVGTNIGAGQPQRALRIALTGGAIAFALCEAVGLAAAFWPVAWLSLFDQDPQMLEAGAAYLRTVGPAYGFFGLGLCLYFASQGAGKLWWPLLAGSLRLVIAVGGAWVALQVTGSLDWVFAALAVALVVYGIGLTAAVASGAWFRTAGRSPKTRADRHRARSAWG
jgi:Na+-driven multidrug efflux pump